MNKTRIKAMVAMAVLGAAVLGCVAVEPLQTMRGADVPAADQAPQDMAYQGKRPGELRLIARTFEGQPPLIPHSIANYEEITATDNPCLECHISSEYKGKKMPRVSDSHLVAKPTAARPDPQLHMSRWQCNTCHVPQVDAKPLVENEFLGRTTGAR